METRRHGGVSTVDFAEGDNRVGSNLRFVSGHRFSDAETEPSRSGFTGCGKIRMCSKRYEGFHRLMRYVRSMRGNDEQQGAVFSYINPEERIPSDHPLRSIRAMVDGALQELWAHFEALYARRGRPSIPPEKLLRALLLQVLYSLRSERQLMEQLDYNLLYRWFVGLNPDDEVWDVTVFTKNRERLLQGEIAQRLLEAVLQQARAHDLLSAEHFTVD